MSKSITSNLLLINDLQSQINTLDFKVDNFTETQFDAQINAIHLSNIFDQHGKERFTGSKDWHFRFDFYSNIDGINHDNLNQYSDIKPLFTDYIHAKNLEKNLVINPINLGFYEENIDYIIKVSTNILFNDKIEKIRLQDTINHYSLKYSYYINNKIVQYNNIRENTTHPKLFYFNKGWNRIDIFLSHDHENTNDIFKFYFNPLNSLTNTVNEKDDITLSDTNYLYDRVEHFTAYFINSTQLIPNNQLEVKDISVDSFYYLKQYSNLNLDTISYNYTSLFWDSDYHITKTIDNYDEDKIYILDRIIIKNNNSELNNVWLEFNIDTNHYNCNEILQNIEDEYIIHNLHLPISNGNTINHSLSNINNLITTGYSIDFHISIQHTLLEKTKDLKISNNIHENSIFIKNDGSVGIGTNDTKSYSLYVNNISNHKKGIFCTDDITILSDIRYKTDIEPILNASEKLLQLNGVTYKKNGKKEFGLIAQEVQDVLPELVIENEDELGINYIQIIALLIEGYKDLKKEMNKMKRFI